MAFPVAGAQNASEFDIPDAVNYPHIRTFQVRRCSTAWAGLVLERALTLAGAYRR